MDLVETAICPYISKHIIINKLNDNIIKDEEINEIIKGRNIEFINDNIGAISGL